MRELTIGKNDAGQRLDRFVSKSLPLLPPALLQKYIRLKRIKLNNKGAKRDTRLNEGDTLQLYINDEFFDKPREDNAYLTVATPKLNIVYEDENILLVDKEQGLIVHPDKNEYVNNPYRSTDLLFGLGGIPLFIGVDSNGNIDYISEGGEECPSAEYPANKEDVLDYISKLFGDEGFIGDDPNYYTSTD